MKPTVLTPVLAMCATRASLIKLSFCVVLNTQRFLSSIGSTTAGVPTGASNGVFASATNWSAPIAFGEPEGPMIASTFSSSSSLRTSVTVWVESDASSNTMYSTLIAPICFGNNAALFFCGMPTTAVGPVADEITPTFICAVAAQVAAAANSNTAARSAFTTSMHLSSNEQLNRGQGRVGVEQVHALATHAQRALLDAQVMKAGPDERLQFVALRFCVLKLAAHDIPVCVCVEALDRGRLQQMMTPAWRLLRKRTRTLETLNAQCAQQVVLVKMRVVLAAFRLIGHQRDPVDAIAGEKRIPLVVTPVVEQARLAHHEIDQRLVRGRHSKVRGEAIVAIM